MGNYLDFALKIAHRRHRLSQGQEKDVLYARIVKLCIITVFLLFLLFGIKPILLIFSGSNKKIRSKIKIQLATFSAQS